MPVKATEQPKAVASGCETILIDQASRTSRVVSTPSQKSSRRHRSAAVLRSDGAAASSIPPGNTSDGDCCPLKREGGDAWVAAREPELTPAGEADSCPFTS